MNKLLATTALVFSLACAGAYADDHAHGKPGYDGSHFMDTAISKLPEKDAAQFRATMKDAREKNKATFEQVHAMRKDLQAIMTAPTFDKGAYLAKNAEIQKLQAGMHASMSEAFATAVSQLSQDERKTLSDALHHGHDGHMHKSGDGAASDSMQ